MTCRELIDLLMDYRSNELLRRDRRAVDEHLSGCGDCVAYLGSYEATIRFGKAAFRDVEAAAPDLPEDLVEAILHARKIRARS